MDPPISSLKRERIKASPFTEGGQRGMRKTKGMNKSSQQPHQFY
jgi:hypothetical protein